MVFTPKASSIAMLAALAISGGAALTAATPGMAQAHIVQRPSMQDGAADGQTQAEQQTRWRTIYRANGTSTGTRGRPTSSGDGSNTTRDVSVADDSATINRNLRTNAGRTLSRSRDPRFN